MISESSSSRSEIAFLLLVLSLSLRINNDLSFRIPSSEREKQRNALISLRRLSSAEEKHAQFVIVAEKERKREGKIQSTVGTIAKAKPKERNTKDAYVCVYIQMSLLLTCKVASTTPTVAEQKTAQKEKNAGQIATWVLPFLSFSEKKIKAKSDFDVVVVCRRIQSCSFPLTYTLM